MQNWFQANKVTGFCRNIGFIYTGRSDQNAEVY